MTFGRSSKWRQWRQHIIDRCDQLTRGMTPPIPLQEIFAKCHVKEVVFQPLLLEAALAVDADGFVVFVNCDDATRYTYQCAFDSVTQKGRYLPGRVRFSLAHELVHTFFYDTKQQPYINKLSASNSKEIESLEYACNFGASNLLLPARSLKSQTQKADIISVNGIVSIAKKYQVSIQCLINRLEHLQLWTAQRGLVALVDETAGKHRVKAVAKSVGVRELFNDVRVDSDLEEGLRMLPLPFEKMRRSIGPISFDLAHPKKAGRDVAKCRLEYRRVARTKHTFVLAVSVYEVPRVNPAHKDRPAAGHHIAKLKEIIKQRGASRQRNDIPTRTRP